MHVIKVTAEVTSGYSTQVIQKNIEKLINSIYEGADINFYFVGEKQTITKYLKGLCIAALISLTAIFIILMIQFN